MDKKGVAIERIVRVARSRFSREGYQKTSTESLLQDLQMSRGALYHHFKSKEEIFVAVLDAVEAEVASVTFESARKHTDPLAALHAGLHSFLILASRDDVKQIVLVDAPAVVGWQKWREMEGRYALGGLKQGLSAIAAQGKLDPELVDTLAHLLLANLVELALLVAYSDNPKRTLRLARKALKQLLAGLV